MAERRQPHLAGRLTKNLTPLKVAQNSNSRRSGPYLPDELNWSSKDPYDLSDSSQDGHGERKARRPAKRAKLDYGVHPGLVAGQHGEENPTAKHYPTPKLTSEPSNASSTLNLWPFSTTYDSDLAEPGSLAATVANLDEFIDESCLHHAQPDTPVAQSVDHDGNHTKQEVRNWVHLTDSSKALEQNQVYAEPEEGLANHAGLARDDESRRVPHVGYATDVHRENAVDFTHFVNFTQQDAEEESYSIGSLDEEDLIKLVDSVDPPSRHTPPTSVLRDMSIVSSVGAYDPNLQRSPPGKAPEKPEEEELLDSDIDWSPILEELSTQPNPHPLDQSASQPATTIKPTQTPKSELAPSRQQAVQPFTRPPFPQTLRDKSPICGLSNLTVLRTCFRLGHLIAENNHNSSRNQDAVYELYARVNYSHRNRPSSTHIPLFNVVKHDNSARMQHFQFADLWRDTPPYVWGVLENWRPDGVLDKQSSVFLSSGPPPSQFTQGNDVERERKLCRCICRISKAPSEESQGGGRNKRSNPDIGRWVMKVLWIEEIGWETIERMKTFTCQE
ncbi:hypothetical protein QBC40DRAFT_348137 [Triangularia verruculosa]|uniref:Uncharacterized protein n=1 Tax=Triangularia verruculosa TaxID=2587418 RepID=A0AAN7AXQ7_9PEZI|nr:hypothetical protein QBC40DRAFT_348137 [Triangularia verruculosa]